MQKKIVIIDSASSNIFSVRRAFEYCGGDVTVSNDPQTIHHADYLILPGVGTFGHCMAVLNHSGVIAAIREFVALQKPLLGICVGMQILFERGLEFGEHAGLGFIPGVVKKIPATSTHKVPHVGWYKLNAIGKNQPLFAGIPENAYAYFVHSYMADLTDKAAIVADYEDGGVTIPAIVNKGRVYGSQCHLEKSGEVGLNIIRNFLRL